MIAWIRISGIVVALYSSEVLSSNFLCWHLAIFKFCDGKPKWAGFVLTLLGVGGVFALIMFAISAWSLPA